MDIEDKRRGIFPIKCPFNRLSRKDGKLYRCNSVCNKASADSFGEARCRKCKLSFDYEIDKDGVVNSFVTAKSIEKA